MNALKLYLHCGGEKVERHQLADVRTPVGTDTWQPVAHNEYVNMIQDELESKGIRVISEAHGLTRTAKNFDGTANEFGFGANYFGMFQVQSDNLKYEDHSTIIGFRNSHIKRLSANLALGSGVFVCDNLAFSGEIVIGRKHTKNVLHDELGIRPMIIEAISKILIVNEKQEERFEEYKSANLNKGDAEVIMIDALRNKIVKPTQLPKLVQQWDSPDHEEFAKNQNVWRMFNAVTETLKGTSPIELPGRTAKLHSLLDHKLGIEPLDFELKQAA